MVGRRRVRVAGLVLAVSLVSACGSPAQPVGSGPRLELSAGSNSSGGGLASSKVASAEAADALMAPWVEYRYVLADGSYPEAGSRPGFKLVAELPSRDQVVALAESLGFVGVEPELSADGSRWEMPASTDIEGVSAQYLVADEFGSWWFQNNTVTYPEWLCDDDGVCELDPSSVKPTDQAAADKAAEKVFLSGGARDGVAEGVASDGFYSVTFTESVDGAPSDRMWQATFIGDELVSAYGSFASLEALGDYVTVSAVDASSRLDDYRWARPFYGAGGGPAVMSSSVARSAEPVPVQGSGVVTGVVEVPSDDVGVVDQPGVPVAPDVVSAAPVGDVTVASSPGFAVCAPVDATDPRVTGGSGDVVVDPPVVDTAVPVDATVPVDAEPLPPLLPAEPEVVTVSLTEVSEVYVTWWAGAETYLLPGYQMSGDDISVVVLAVEDDAVAFVDDVLVTDVPVVELPASDPVDGRGDGSSADELPALDVSTGSGGSAPSDVVPAVEPVSDVTCLVGLSEGAAQAQVEASGMVFRVTERDGEAFAMTMDYRFDRVNVVVVAGVVTSASVG